MDRYKPYTIDVSCTFVLQLSHFLSFSLYILLHREESHDMEAVRCHCLGIILFGLPSETRPSTDKQKGSVASLTFPFSSSRLTLGHPFISTDCCSLHCLWSWMDLLYILRVWGGTRKAHLSGDGNRHGRDPDLRQTWGRHREIHVCIKGHVHLQLSLPFPICRGKRCLQLREA